MSDTKHLFHTQSILAHYCKTGDDSELFGVNRQNITQYRRLVYNIMDDMLKGAFPLSYQLLSKNDWDPLVENFLRTHSCQSSQVWKMPKEFYTFLLETDDKAILNKFPFLFELLHLEWMETELFMMPDKPSIFKNQGDIKKDPFIFNPEFHLHQFNYPVHLKPANAITEEDLGSYFLVLHRHPITGEILFTNITAPLAILVELLSERSLNFEQITSSICNQIQILPNEQIIEQLENFVIMSLETKLILGFAIN